MISVKIIDYNIICLYTYSQYPNSDHLLVQCKRAIIINLQSSKGSIESKCNIINMQLKHVLIVLAILSTS